MNEPMTVEREKRGGSSCAAHGWAFRVWHKERQQYFDDLEWWGHPEHGTHLMTHLFVTMDQRVMWSQFDGVKDITSDCEIHWPNTPLSGAASASARKDGSTL